MLASEPKCSPAKKREKLIFSGKSQKDELLTFIPVFSWSA